MIMRGVRSGEALRLIGDSSVGRDPPVSRARELPVHDATSRVSSKNGRHRLVYAGVGGGLRRTRSCAPGRTRRDATARLRYDRDQPSGPDLDKEDAVRKAGSAGKPC